MLELLSVGKPVISFDSSLESQVGMVILEHTEEVVEVFQLLFWRQVLPLGIASGEQASGNKYHEEE
ncbi:MAG TPA: hypothetical protein GX500_03280 [Firmicutes bacterium]|nr:hypothetical protein [Candidatus Fermentithermobacillaceae bacterium]